MTGVFAIVLEHHPRPGPVAIWLFVTGAAVGYTAMVGASNAHRSSAPIQAAHGYQLFNLSPILVVPLVSLVHWWIRPAPIAYLFAGLAASCTYLLAVSLLFHGVRRRPR